MNVLYILVALQVLDLVTTVIALRNPNLGEGNGLLKPMMDAIGVVPTLVIIKAGFIGLLYWAAPQVPVEVLYGLSAFYVWVVFNNIKLIRSH